MAKRARGWEKVVGRRKRPVRTGVRSSPPGKRRLLVSKVTKPRILEIIRDWPGKTISWAQLMAAINSEFHGKWVRAAVAKYPDLQRAFSETQERLRKEALGKGKKAGRVRRTRDEEIEYLKKQIELLKRENADVKGQLAETQARLGRWRHNAVMHRITVRQLDAPMQENNRGRSDA